MKWRIICGGQLRGTFGNKLSLIFQRPDEVERAPDAGGRKRGEGSEVGTDGGSEMEIKGPGTKDT